MTSPLLAMEQLTTGYRRGRSVSVVSRDLSAHMQGGELVCLLGPNGAGKSTLMQTIVGALTPVSGQVSIAGRDVHQMPARERARTLAVVLTERVTAGLLTGYDLVAMGRHPYTDWSGRLSPLDHDVIVRALEATEAVEFAQRFTGELSDGERQRVMVARALAQQPSLLVLDEVMAFLDLPHRVLLLRLLRKLAHESGMAILLSIHDFDLALRGADRIWLLSKGGTLTQGAPEDLVLSGALHGAFGGDGLEFDQAAGAYHLRKSGGGTPIGLVGSGLSADWTRRGLERCGYAVVGATNAPVVVEVHEETSGPRWRIRREGVTEEHPSCGAALEALHRHRTPATNA